MSQLELFPETKITVDKPQIRIRNTFLLFYVDPWHDDMRYVASLTCDGHPAKAQKEFIEQARGIVKIMDWNEEDVRWKRVCTSNEVCTSGISLHNIPTETRGEE
ncbi:hypothetical protein D3C71_1550230 [compost metagenome]